MKKIFFLILLSIILSSCGKTIEKDLSSFSWWNSFGNISSWWTIKSTITNISNSLTWETNINKLKTPDIKIASGTYCLLDECIPENLEISKIWFNFVANKEEVVSNDDPKNKEYKLRTDKTSYVYNFSEMMHVVNTSIEKLWDYYIKNISDWSCWWWGFEQKVYDKDWYQIKDFIPENYPRTIKVWNLDYDLSLTESWKEIWINDEVNWFEFIYEKINSNDTPQKIINNKIRDTKHIYSNYALKISENNRAPFLLFYKARQDIKFPIRVIYLWTDINYLSTNIWSNWELKDIKVTNKILSYFSNNWSENKRILNEKWEILSSISNLEEAIFTVKKLDDNGNYMTYVQEPYSWQTYAEMCKPVVYFYSKKQEKNSLRLQLRKDDKFTKIIPDFTSKNTWDFLSQIDWTIKIANKIYPYFYYSILVKDYKSNNNWWIVYWADIWDFFNDKLDKIWFNKVEKKDFMDFWLKEYEKDKYYFVSFKYKDKLDEIVKFNFNIAPKNEFRVLLDTYEYENISSERIEKFLYNKSKKYEFDNILIKKFNRNKTENEVFEWGWVFIKSNEIVVY